MTVPLYNLTDTWNNGATAFDAIKMNVTDTGHAAASTLINLQIGGTQLLSAGPTGILSVTSTQAADNSFSGTGHNVFVLTDNGATGAIKHNYWFVQGIDQWFLEATTNLSGLSGNKVDIGLGWLFNAPAVFLSSTALSFIDSSSSTYGVFSNDVSAPGGGVNPAHSNVDGMSWKTANHAYLLFGQDDGQTSIWLFPDNNTGGTLTGKGGLLMLNNYNNAPCFRVNWQGQLELGDSSSPTPAAVKLYGSVDTLTNPTNYERVGIYPDQGAGTVHRIMSEAGGTGTIRIIAIDGFTKAGAAVAGDLPSGAWGLIHDSSGATTKLCYNDAGTLRTVTLT